MSVPRKPARIAGVEEAPAEWRGGVVAIGNFDGVHRGHQAVLSAARVEADRRGVACLMLTLEPHPRAFFSGQPMFRLTPAPLKAAAAAALGFDGTLILPFDRALADKSAEDFVAEILVRRLAISAAVTGYDFHFGKARRGTPQFLQEEGESHGFSVSIVDALGHGGEAVSSTAVREALGAGDLARANALLGWHFSIAATVVHGDARGRELGYPTANMALDPGFELAHGIYAVRFLRADGDLISGVASYGRRPTFDNGRSLFETFLFDFAGDLYGQTALISTVAFIRPELKFSSAEALVRQMDRDAVEARRILEHTPHGELDVAIQAAWLSLRQSA